MGFWDFFQPPAPIMLGRELGLIVSSEDLYDDAIGGFSDKIQLLPKLSGAGKVVVAFIYRPLNFPAGKYMAQIGDKAYFKKGNGLALHEEVVALYNNKLIFRGFHGGMGFAQDPKLDNYFLVKEYKLHKKVMVLNDTVDAHALLESMGKDSRFDDPSKYDFVQRNCQFFSQAVRDMIIKQGALKFRADVK
ncbi:MAG: hypothetical protein OEY58_22165 [Gammaproteobacteria bacterium]|nr:hypothetical protein [Gammaproteobacteria bacterium]